MTPPTVRPFLQLTPRGASVTARTDCLFLTLTGQQFTELLRMTPDVRAMVERIAQSRGHERVLERR